VRNTITGSISLTPQTYVDGVLQPAKQVLPYTDFASLINNPIAWKLILLVFIQVIFVTMVYGPIAAYLVEAFPARIRYTSLSLPYHIGNGVFGGLLPLIGLYVVAETGNYLRWFVLSHNCGRRDVHCGFAIAQGNQECSDLGGDGDWFRTTETEHLIYW